MTDIKHCDYRRNPHNEECGEPFERPANTLEHNWAMRTRCDKHMKYGGNKPLVDRRKGQYEVKNKTIDHFLYATTPPQEI